MQEIYLDHNATVSTEPAVLEAMERARAVAGANPSSRHPAGKRSLRLIEDAREQLAGLLGARLDPDDPSADRIIFTSGATEANNLAVRGLALARWAQICEMREPPSNQKPYVLISSAEHGSVVEPTLALLEFDGFEYDLIGLTEEGHIDNGRLARQLADPPRGMLPVLIAAILASHETGVIQPIDTTARMGRDNNVAVHTDAVQAIGRMPVDFRRLSVTSLSIAGHKLGGPHGIGALVVRGDVPIRPILFGGGQQGRLRPGTEPADLIVGLVCAVRLRVEALESTVAKLTALRDRFESQLLAGLPDAKIHGRLAERIPQTVSITPRLLDAGELVDRLGERGVMCSAGAACCSEEDDPSPTLLAMNLTEAEAKSAIRLSFGPEITAEDLDKAAEIIIDTCRNWTGGNQ